MCWWYSNKEFSPTEFPADEEGSNPISSFFHTDLHELELLNDLLAKEFVAASVLVGSFFS